MGVLMMLVVRIKRLFLTSLVCFNMMSGLGLGLKHLLAEEEALTGITIAEAARSQVGVTTIYDGSYVSMSYPNGDVPMERGVCTDVVVRALRVAMDFDLQKEVHQDMKAHFSSYPTIWRLKRPDKNIDHRRVPNLRTFFKRRGWEVLGKLKHKKGGDFLAGDLVTCTVPPNLPHIMVVSDKKTSKGEPLVLHNIGSGTVEEQRLFAFPLTGHYRISIKP